MQRILVDDDPLPPMRQSPSHASDAEPMDIGDAEEGDNEAAAGSAAVAAAVAPARLPEPPVLIDISSDSDADTEDEPCALRMPYDPIAVSSAAAAAIRKPVGTFRCTCPLIDGTECPKSCSSLGGLKQHYVRCHKLTGKQQLPFLTPYQPAKERVAEERKESSSQHKGAKSAAAAPAASAATQKAAAAGASKKASDNGSVTQDESEQEAEENEQETAGDDDGAAAAQQPPIKARMNISHELKRRAPVLPKATRASQKKRTRQQKPAEDKPASNSKTAVVAKASSKKKKPRSSASAASSSAAASSAAAAASSSSSAAAAAAVSSAGVGADGLESCSESEWSDDETPNKSLWNEEEQMQLLPQLWRKMDLREGKFRHTQGWPRALNGVLWDEDLADNFDFCWRCPRTRKNSGPAYAELVACDGICQRSFHHACIGAKAHYNPDEPFFCFECASARFQKPKSASKRSVKQRKQSGSLGRPRGKPCNRHDPVRRTVLMCAIEDHRLRDDPDRPDERKHAYLTYLLNTPGLVERRIRASINCADRERGYTALFYATSHSCLTPGAITLRLLELGAHPNVQSSFPADYHATPFHFAMHRQDMNAILPLLTDPRLDLRARCRGQLAFLDARAFYNGRGWKEPLRAQWAICLVFSVLFAFAEQLIKPKACVDDEWLQSQLSKCSGTEILDALRFAWMVMTHPELAASFRTDFEQAWLASPNVDEQEQPQQQPRKVEAQQPHSVSAEEKDAAMTASDGSDPPSEHAPAAAAPVAAASPVSAAPAAVSSRPRGGRAQQLALIDALFAALRDQFNAGEVPECADRVQLGLQQYAEWTDAFHRERMVGGGKATKGRAIGGSKANGGSGAAAASLSSAVSVASVASASAAAAAGGGRKRRASGSPAHSAKKSTHHMPKRSRLSESPSVAASPLVPALSTSAAAAAGPCAVSLAWASLSSDDNSSRVAQLHAAQERDRARLEVMQLQLQMRERALEIAREQADALP
jgi:hypothetical protein